MKAAKADIVWVPVFPADWYETDGFSKPENEGSVRIESHLSGWKRTEGDRWMPAAKGFGMGFECDTPTPQQIKHDEAMRLLSIFVLFNTLVVRDGIDPSVAHKAFLEIDEYRRAISPDAPGAATLRSECSTLQKCPENHAIEKRHGRFLSENNTSALPEYLCTSKVKPAGRPT